MQESRARSRNKKRKKFDIAGGITGDLLEYFTPTKGWNSKGHTGQRVAGKLGGVEGSTVHLTSLSASSAHKRLNDFSFTKHHWQPFNHISKTNFLRTHSTGDLF